MSDTGGGNDQRYIRTFAGDIAVTQKGGKPDLAPIAEYDKLVANEQATTTPAPGAPQPESVVPAPAPLAPPTAPLPTAPIPPEVPQVNLPQPTLTPNAPTAEADSAPKPFEWNEQMRAAALVRLHAQMAQDKARGMQRSTEISRPIGISSDEVEAETETARVEPLRTYSSDFTDRVKSKGASAMTILAAEQDSGHSATSVVSPQVKKTLYVVIGVGLLLVGGVGAYIGYTQYQAAHAPVVIAPTLAAPIFFEEKEEVVEKGAAIVAAIVASAGKSLSPNTVRLLYSNDATTTQETLFVAARFAAPNIVRRNIVGNGASMAGILNTNGSTAPFFILGVGSYNETFAGMLSWEKTMSKDLAAIFPPYPAPVVSTTTATSTATTTPKKPAPAAAPTKPAARAATTTASTTPRVAVTAGFRDEVIANHDVRVYRDDQGRTLFLYGYWSQTVLVIARDAAAFTELAERLAGSRPQP